MSNIVSTILILASIGLFFGYIKPSWSGDTSIETEMSRKSISDLRAVESQYQSAFDKVREIEEARDSLLNRYNKISEEDRKKLYKLLPAYIDSVRLIIDINNVAAAYGMSLKGIKLNEDTSVKTAVKKPATGSAPSSTATPVTSSASSQNSSYVDLSFEVSGSYENFYSFLSDLEKSLRVVDINSITFSSEEKGINKYDVSVRTYKLP